MTKVMNTDDDGDAVAQRHGGRIILVFRRVFAYYVMEAFVYLGVERMQALLQYLWCRKSVVGLEELIVEFRVRDL